MKQSGIEIAAMRRAQRALLLAEFEMGTKARDLAAREGVTIAAINTRLQRARIDRRSRAERKVRQEKFERFVGCLSATNELAKLIYLARYARIIGRDL